MGKKVFLYQCVNDDLCLHRAAPTAPSCQSVGLSCRVSGVVFGHRSTCSHCNSDCLTTTPQLLALQHRQCGEHQRYSHCQHYSCAVRYLWQQHSGWMCSASALWSSERGVCDNSWTQTDVCWWWEPLSEPQIQKSVVTLWFSCFSFFCQVCMKDLDSVSSCLSHTKSMWFVIAVEWF